MARKPRKARADTKGQSVPAVLQQQMHDVQMLRRMVQRGLATLQGQLDRLSLNHTEAPKLWDGKDDCLAALSKLAQLQMKLIPLEQALLAKTTEMQADTPKAAMQNPAFSDAELKALAAAIERKLEQNAAG